MNPRVLIYSDCPIFGGAENLLVNIIEHSDIPREFDVHFVYRGNKPYTEGVRRKITKPIPLTALWLPDRLEWIDVMEAHVQLLPLRWLFKAVFRAIEPLLFLYDVLRLWGAFAGIRPDVVQINNGGYPGSLGCRAAAVAAKLAGARRVIFIVNSAAKPLSLPKAALEPLFDSLVIRSSDVFVTASRFAGKALAARGFPADRIIQIPNSTPIPRPAADASRVRAELGLGPGDVAFAVIAYFGPWKGHKILVEAVAALKREHAAEIRNLRIVLIGEGPDLERIRRQVAHGGVEDHFSFAGFRSDAMELLNACDGLILPSIFWKGVSEDMPYCVLEAMALSKPVVASRLSGIAETVVHEDTGLLIAPNDAATLAQAILRMHSDPGLRSRMGARGRERFLEFYETGRTAKSYSDLYLSVLRERAAGKPRVLIYADCPVFGGADVLTVHILQDERHRALFDFTYVYRHNRRFRAGLRQRLPAGMPLTRVFLLERQELLDSMEKHVTIPLLRYCFKAVFRLADYALFPIEVALLWRTFRGIRPDLAHINNGGYPGALGCRAAAVAAKLAGARRVVFGVNNLARPLRLPWELGDAAIDRLVLSSTDLFVTASLGARDALAKRGFPKKLIEACPNGVAVPRSVRPAPEVRSELRLGDRQVAFAMVAYFEPRKGHMVLVEAVRRFVESRPDAAAGLRFILVADGPELATVRRAVRQHRLDGMFSFLGYRTDVLDILNACDALILPSVAAEDMPISILEAMALSKPVIASDLAGISQEVSDGRTGFLVPPGRPSALAEAIERLASSPRLRHDMGLAGKERFLELFEIHKSAERFLTLYSDLLGPPAIRH